MRVAALCWQVLELLPRMAPNLRWFGWCSTVF